jgi:hypothetical protein
MAGDKIGMEVGFQDMGDFHAHGLRRIKVDLDVSARINDGTGL